MKTEAALGESNEPKDNLSGLSEQDAETAKKLLQTMEAMNSFSPSGDILADANEIIKITGRDKQYKKVEYENPAIVLVALMKMRDICVKIVKSPEEVDVFNFAKKLFFIDVPQADIDMFNRVITFYEDKF
jgi:hypothetical protein